MIVWTCLEAKFCKKSRQCWISNLQGNLEESKLHEFQRRVRMKHPLDAGALIETIATNEWFPFIFLM